MAEMCLLFEDKKYLSSRFIKGNWPCTFKYFISVIVEIIKYRRTLQPH